MDVCLFLAQTAVCVGDLDGQLLCTLDNQHALLAADVVSDFAGVLLVEQQQQVEVGDVLDQQLLEAVGHLVAGLLVGAVADLGHGDLALEAAAHSVVDTLGLAPRVLHYLEIRPVCGNGRPGGA